MVSWKPVARLSTLEIEHLITRAEVGQTVAGLRYSEALQFQENRQVAGPQNTASGGESGCRNARSHIFETPNETLRRIQRLQPLR